MLTKRSGFTLVEILIVVVILGILAAVVIPQFSDASTDAKTNSLMADLQTVRSQIELYKIQHNDAMPGTATGVDFATAMTSSTDIDGATTGSDYGPYMRAIPTNPFNDKSAVDTTGTAGDDVGGWEYDSSDGSFVADDSAAHAAL